MPATACGRQKKIWAPRSPSEEIPYRSVAPSDLTILSTPQTKTSSEKEDAPSGSPATRQRSSVGPWLCALPFRVVCLSQHTKLSRIVWLLAAYLKPT